MKIPPITSLKLLNNNWYDWRFYEWMLRMEQENLDNEKLKQIKADQGEFVELINELKVCGKRRVIILTWIIGKCY